MKALLLSLAFMLTADAALNHGHATKGIVHVLAASLGPVGKSVSGWVYSG